MEELNSRLKVGLRFSNETIPVGTLAMSKKGTYFQYESSFIAKGLEISPIKFKLKPDVQNVTIAYLDELPGVFHDSLPDAWGIMLQDKLLRKKKISTILFSAFDRLAIVGSKGMGALVYEPDKSFPFPGGEIDLNTIAEEAGRLLHLELSEETGELALQRLHSLNGSSGGARPKVVVGIDSSMKKIVYGQSELESNYRHWLVKFPAKLDSKDSGAIEYVYALMAKDAGITMPKVHLFPAEKAAGYFAIERFDRIGNDRVHMHTASGLLHEDFHMLSLDYEDLIKLTMTLTKDMREVEKMFRLATFNILACNRDDHGKNFSFVMGKDGQWQLAPGYDITFCLRPGRDHSTSVMGEGANPGIRELTKLGLCANLKKSNISMIIEQTKEALNQWQELAKNHGVDEINAKEIGSKIDAQIRSAA